MGGNGEGARPGVTPLPYWPPGGGAGPRGGGRGAWRGRALGRRWRRGSPRAGWGSPPGSAVARLCAAPPPGSWHSPGRCSSAWGECWRAVGGLAPHGGIGSPGRACGDPRGSSSGRLRAGNAGTAAVGGNGKVEGAGPSPPLPFVLPSAERCRPEGVGLHPPPPFLQQHPPPCPYEDRRVRGVALWEMLCGWGWGRDGGWSVSRPSWRLSPALKSSCINRRGSNYPGPSACWSYVGLPDGYTGLRGRDVCSTPPWGLPVPPLPPQVQPVCPHTPRLPLLQAAGEEGPRALPPRPLCVPTPGLPR